MVPEMLGLAGADCSGATQMVGTIEHRYKIMLGQQNIG